MNETLRQDFPNMRNRLLNDALLWISSAAVPGVALSIARGIIFGCNPLIYLHILMLALLWMMWLGRARLPYHFRVSGLLTVAWLSTFGGLITFGPIAFSGLHAILFSFIAILFLGGRLAGWLIAGNTLCLMIFGWAASQHWLHFDLDYQVYAYHPLTWIRTVWAVTSYAIILALIGWRMMQGLLESEATARELLMRQNKIAANLPGVIYQFLLRKDGTCCFPYASEGMTRFFGIDPKTLKTDGAAVFTLIHPDDRNRVWQSIELSARDLALTHESFRIIHPQQGVVWLERTSTPERLPNGDTLWHGFIKDVTALKVAEQRLAATLENTPNVAVQWYDQNGRVLYWNHACELLFGWTAAEAIGNTADELTHSPQDMCGLLAILERISASGATIGPVEVANRHRDGRKLVVLSTIFSIPSGDSPIFVCMDIDITERKRIEDSLWQSEDKFRSLFELAPVGIALNDYATGQFLEINDALLASTGYSHDQFLALDYWDITPQDYASQEQGQLQAMDRTGRYGPYEKEYIRKDGNRYPVLLNGIKRIDPRGRAVIWSIVQDISERKRAEMALEQAKSEAESANRAKSEFLTSMSHELRTPLNAIIGFAQLLEMGELMPLHNEQKIAVGHIMNSGRQLLQLINEALDLARIESGKLDLNIEAVALPPLIGEAVLLSLPAATTRHITIKQSCPGEMHVRADLSRMRQVLLNLLSNAIKYNREGGNVILSCALVGGTVRITVADTGIGIPDEYRSEIFQPFQRLGAQNTVVEGTGIGLVVCKRLVEAMDGKIGYDSIIGVGSHFWVELPLAASADGVATTPPVEAKWKSPDNRGTACGRVLYIEDSPINVNVMKHVFHKHLDVGLQTAESAEDGLELIHRTPPELVLMDINLGGMSGLEALKILKSDPATAAIPVIAVSAAAMPGDVAAGLEAGFSAYLTKPFDVPELIALVRKFLQKQTE